MTSVMGSLAPGLLIAPPSLLDPNFVKSVVLLAVHNEGGALGFVVNRAAHLTVGDLLSMAGYGDALKRHTRPVLVGGPVQPSSVWVLASDPSLDLGRKEILGVGDNLRITSTRAALDDYVQQLESGGGPDPLQRLVLAGYSGWGPGQLEGELAAGAWLPVELDEDIVLDGDLDAKWERAYERHGLSPAGVINMRGGGEA
jgi:putative transcriptional regulator